MSNEAIGYATYRTPGGDSLHGELGHDEQTNWMFLDVPIFNLDGRGVGSTKYLITSGCFEMLEQTEYLARLRIKFRRMVRESQPQQPLPKPKTEIEELRENVAAMSELLKRQAYANHPGLLRDDQAIATSSGINYRIPAPRRIASAIRKP